MPNALIVVIADIYNKMFRGLQSNDFYNILISNDWTKVKPIIYKSQKNTILITNTLYKNVSMPTCQLVIIH